MVGGAFQEGWLLRFPKWSDGRRLGSLVEAFVVWKPVRARGRFSADREPCKSITSSSTWPVPREMARSSSGGSEASQVSGNGDVIGKLMHAGALVCDCQVATMNESAIEDEKRREKGEMGEVESRDCGFERVPKYTCTAIHIDVHLTYIYLFIYLFSFHG